MVGFVTRPLSGALELLSSTSEGIANSSVMCTERAVTRKRPHVSGRTPAAMRKVSLLKYRCVARFHDDEYVLHCFAAVEKISPTEASTIYSEDHLLGLVEQNGMPIKEAGDNGDLHLSSIKSRNSTLILCHRTLLVMIGDDRANDEVHYQLAVNELLLSLINSYRDEMMISVENCQLRILLSPREIGALQDEIGRVVNNQKNCELLI
eukprot:955883_1